MDLLQFKKVPNDIADEVSMFRRNIEKMIIDNELLKKTNQWWIREEFPVHDIVRMLNAAALMPLDTVIGEMYGCGRVSYLMYGLVSEMIEALDSGFRGFLPSVIKGLVRYPIYAFGSEEQKEKYLPGLADGSLIGCFALTGPPGGSNPRNMEMKARIEKDGRILLNGDKHWITNGSIADIAIVWANTTPGDPKGIRAFIVERGTPGFSQKKIKNKIGLRVSDTGNLSFSNCVISSNAMLPGTHQGIKTAYACLNQARFSIGWGVIGVAKACFREALAFAGDRMISDEYGNLIPLKQDKTTYIDFGKMASCIKDMELRAWDVAEKIDANGGIITPESEDGISDLKLYNVAQAMAVVDDARKILGSNGLYVDEEGNNQTPRHFTNLPFVQTYEGTPRVHEIVAGRKFAQ